MGSFFIAIGVIVAMGIAGASYVWIRTPEIRRQMKERSHLD